MARIFQYHSSIVTHDAIGNSISSVHKGLRARSVDTYLFCRDDLVPSAPAGTLPATSLLQASFKTSIRETDVLIVHYSFYDEIAETLAALPIRTILVYHNITPGHFFRQAGISWLADLCDAARMQLARMKDCVQSAVGDSEYNSDELRSLGFRNVSTIPVAIDLGRLSGAAPDLEESFTIHAASDVNILFVGRFVPNKRIELLISTLAAFARSFPLSVNLHLAGKVWDGGYLAALVEHAQALGVLDKVRLHFNADDRLVRALYAAADVFLCMSAHEGFMVPIIEAFAMGCPVVAVDAAAVRETMGGAGLLLDAHDPELAAGLIYRLKVDRRLRNRIIAGQSQRANAFAAQTTHAKWYDQIFDHQRMSMSA